VAFLRVFLIEAVGGNTYAMSRQHNYSRFQKTHRLVLDDSTFSWLCVFAPRNICTSLFSAEEQDGL
jgi:hypothetical protein